MNCEERKRENSDTFGMFPTPASAGLPRSTGEKGKWVSYPKHSPILQEFQVSDLRGYWAVLTRSPSVCLRAPAPPQQGRI